MPSMKQDWTAFLAQQGLSGDFLDCGDLPGELLSAQSGTILAPLADLGLIRASGEEAVLAVTRQGYTEGKVCFRLTTRRPILRT